MGAYFRRIAIGAMQTRNRRFVNLEELNATIHEELVRPNGRVSRHLDASRLDLFERLDKPALIPMPPTRHADRRSVTVGADYHIRIDNQCYSVPCGDARTAFWVRIKANTVKVAPDAQRSLYANIQRTTDAPCDIGRFRRRARYFH